MSPNQRSRKEKMQTKSLSTGQVRGSRESRYAGRVASRRRRGGLPAPRPPSPQRPWRSVGEQPCAGLWSFANLTNFANFFHFFFANFRRARSRLYQNEILQENMRLTAVFKLYKICTVLHLGNLKIFAKNLFEKSAIFARFNRTFADVAKLYINL